MIKKLLNIWQEDIYRTILQGAGSGLFVRVVAAFMVVIAQWVLARLMPVQEYGLYAYAMSWITVLAIIARMGADTAVLRFISEYATRYDWSSAHGVIKWAARISFGSGALLAILFMLGLFIFSEEYSLTPKKIVLLIAAIGIPFWSLSSVQAYTLRGLRRIGSGTALDMLIRPVGIIIAVIGFVTIAGIDLNATSAIMLTVAVLFFVMLAGKAWLFSAMPSEVRKSTPRFNARTWTSISLAMLFMSGSYVIMNNAGIIALGILDSKSAAGIFTVLTRLTTLVSFGLLAINAIAAPIIASLYGEGKHADLQRTVRFSARLIFLFTLCAVLFLFLFGQFLLGLFGSEFQDAYDVMMIILIGHLISSLCGTTAYFMGMTGHQKQAAIILMSATILNILMSILLIPQYGLYGAAIATSCSMVLWNVVMLVYVFRYEKINLTAL